MGFGRHAERDEAAIHQHDAARRTQRCDNLVAVQSAIAPVAHDELVICVEGAPGLHPLPLISVGDRLRKDLLVGLNRASARWRSWSRCVPALSQPVELPLAHADEHNAEHGDEDDQQYPTEPQAAHAARLVRQWPASWFITSAVAVAAAAASAAPRPTAIPTRKVVRGAATRSTSCAESRARSSRVRTVASSIVTSLVPSSTDKVFSHCLSSIGRCSSASAVVRPTFDAMGQDDVMGRVTRRHAVLRVSPGEVVRRSDTLAVEEPLEIRLNGESYLVTMRTPGNDIDLVHGLLYSEGIVTQRSDIVLARYCAGSGADGVNSYNVLDVTLATQISSREAVRRNVMTTSACGICGTT